MLKGKFILAVFVSLSCLFPIKSNAFGSDSSKYLKVYEDSLKQLQYGRFDVHNSDKKKEEVNAHFFNTMKAALKLPGSFTYDFDSLTTIAKLTSSDKQFRILNWNLPKQDGTEEYFGFIQSYNSKTKKYTVYPLTEKQADMKEAQSKTYTPDQWLGMLYYKIVEETIDKKPVYTVLAWRGYSKVITQKVIDVITFNADGSPNFGKAIFSNLPSSFKGSPKRLIFQYSSDVAMTLEYSDKKSMILFDHLGPREDGLEGQYQFYGPSFQIDGLAFKNGKWNFSQNVDARNNNHGDDKFQDPEKDDNQKNKKAIYTPH
jgi:hypothetical protein